MPLINLSKQEIASIHMASMVAHPDEAKILAGVSGRALQNDDDARDRRLRNLLNDVPQVIKLEEDEDGYVQWLRQLLQPEKK